jgi:lipopolysaccharide heptosyltransferase I
MNNKLLIIKPSSFGDIIHALPVAGAMARQVPEVIIDWVVRPEYAELLETHPAIRKLFLFDRKRWADPLMILKTVPEIVGLIRSFRKEKYDAVFDLQGLFRSGVLAYLSGAKLRYGFDNAREFAPVFYNKKVRVETEQIHAIDRYMLFIKEMGLDPENLDYNLKIPSEVMGRMEQLLSEDGVRGERPLIVLNPNARWETKRWIPDRFTNLAERLVDTLDAEVIIIGGASDADNIYSVLTGIKRKVHNFSGRTTILQLASLLKRADLMVTCDSGPMHLAAAVGTPVVALFGPTDPIRTGPYGRGHSVLQKDMNCSPCFDRYCRDKENECMRAIMVDEVFLEVRRLLSDSHSSAVKGA